MSAANGIYKVHYGFEVNGKKATEDHYAYVQCAVPDYNSFKTAIVTNNAGQIGPGTFQVYGYHNVGVGAVA